MPNTFRSSILLDPPNTIRVRVSGVLYMSPMLTYISSLGYSGPDVNPGTYVPLKEI